MRRFVQDNHRRSKQWTLRGLHLQVAHTQGKLVRVTSGSVFDVVVDLRSSSPTFGAWWGVELSAENHRMLWVPPGLAHGILVTSPSADFLYKCTDIYSPADERTLAWDDPTLGIEWPLPAGIAAQALGQGRARQELRGHREVPMRVAGARRRRAGGPGGRRNRLPPATRCSRKTRAELDIADEAAIGRALGAKPGRTGSSMRRAYTAVDLAEDEPEQAAAVNDTRGGHSRGRGRALPAAGSLHLSTDFVFDGSSSRAYLPGDAPHPLGVYGATKLGGERRVLGGGCAGIVLRTAWVYAAAGRISCSPCCD